jgi:hypothetical protein
MTVSRLKLRREFAGDPSVTLYGQYLLLND